jgi:hypothetical protein
VSDRTIDIDAVAGMVTAAEIFGPRQVPMPWPSSRDVLAPALELLPTITDDLTADLVQHLTMALVDRHDELRAVRAVLSAALEHSHALTVDRDRLRDQHHRLIDEYRALRVQTLRRQSEAA